MAAGFRGSSSGMPLLVRTGESTDQMTLLKALRRGTNTSAVIIAVAAFPIVWFFLGKDYIGLYVAILAGLFSGGMPTAASAMPYKPMAFRAPSVSPSPDT